MSYQDAEQGGGYKYRDPEEVCFSQKMAGKFFKIWFSQNIIKCCNIINDVFFCVLC